MTAAELVQKVADIYHSVTRHAEPKKLEEIKRVKYKVFYSSLDTFEKPGGRVLMGMYPNIPGPHEYAAEVLNRVPQEGWNAFLNENWEPPKVVENLEALFRGWFGHNWAQEMMRTFCANVCPLRAGSDKEMEELYGGVLEECVALWPDVLAQLKPRLIICHGNKEGLSPYTVLNRWFPADGGKIESGTAIGTLKVKWYVHTAAWGPVAIVGLPNLAKGKPTLLLQNTTLSDFIRKHDAPKRTESRIVRKA